MMVRSLCIVVCLVSACASAEPAAGGGSGGAGSGAGSGAAAGATGAGAGAPAAGTSPPEAGAGAGAPAAGSGGVAGMVPPRDCRPSVDSLAVSGADRVGYPPYASSGCTLLYVAGDGSLRLRGLDDTADETIAQADELPQRPTIAGELIAWESARDQLVRVRFAGKVHDIRGDYDRTGQPRASEDAVVFTGFKGQDADIALYEPANDRVRVIASGAGQQLFPDISATQIAYSDFSEDPDGVFDDDGMDLADVVLVDRATLHARTLKLPGKQAFPLLRTNGDVVYLHWAESHPEPKLSAYTIVAWDAKLDARTELALVQTQPPYVRPSVANDTVEWVERPYTGDERLMRVRQQKPAEVAFSSAGLKLYATASSATLTLLATQSDGEPVPRLRAIGR